MERARPSISVDHCSIWHQAWHLIGPWPTVDWCWPTVNGLLIDPWPTVNGCWSPRAGMAARHLLKGTCFTSWVLFSDSSTQLHLWAKNGLWVYNLGTFRRLKTKCKWHKHSTTLFTPMTTKTRASLALGVFGFRIPILSFKQDFLNLSAPFPTFWLCF